MWTPPINESAELTQRSLLIWDCAVHCIYIPKQGRNRCFSRCLDFCNQTCFSNRLTKSKAKQLAPEEKQKEYCKGTGVLSIEQWTTVSKVISIDPSNETISGRQFFDIWTEAKFLDVIGQKSEVFSSLLFRVISTKGFSPPPPWSKVVWNWFVMQTLDTETSNLRSLKIMPRNLNEIVRSWTRLQGTIARGELNRYATSQPQDAAPPSSNFPLKINVDWRKKITDDKVLDLDSLQLAVLHIIINEDTHCAKGGSIRHL
jgi:hypothetical protein